MAIRTLDEIQLQISATEKLLRNLKEELSKAQRDIEATRQLRNGQDLSERGNGTNGGLGNNGHVQHSQTGSEGNGAAPKRWPLLRDEYARYGRQLIMPEIGIQGQLRLKNAKVLIVGVGGLGCPAAAYLAGAGVGELGLMDGDTVELSNLHRQVAHSTDRIGMNKAESACAYLKGLNPQVRYNRHQTHLTPKTAISIFEDYNLILDCTDHPTSRYLISDACVLTGKPLVSASALRTDGQLIVLNNPALPPGHPSGGPCYRCIFPKPPPADSVISCGEGGVLGPVVGVMGVLQALEAIKILCSPAPKPASTVLTDSSIIEEESPKISMLMFSAYSNPQFRTVRLRSRRANCSVCSADAYITKDTLSSGSLDYVAFCGATTPVNVLSAEQRCSAKDFSGLSEKDRGLIIDVRDETQFAICSLPNSINVPWTGNEGTWHEHAARAGALRNDDSSHYIVCRLGNDSQLAAKAIMERSNALVNVKDLQGGFQAWQRDVDPDWPDY